MPENFSGSDFNFLKDKYWQNEDFRESVFRSSESSKDVKEQIGDYLERIRNIVDKKGALFLKSYLYPKLIIKPEEISDDYLKSVILKKFAEENGFKREDLNDPETKEVILSLFEKYKKIKFSEYSLPEKEREKMVIRIIKDQEESLKRWFFYLSSHELDSYRDAFKYWVFAEATKLGAFKDGRFAKRTKKTIAPFPELNEQALMMVLDEISKKHSGKSSEIEDENFLEHLKNESFRKLYAFALRYVHSLDVPEERLKVIKGEWKVFKRGSDPKKLSSALEGFNTGWCITHRGTAEDYLEISDIHIYFSEDEKGENSIPRVTIVKAGSEIKEVRGIYGNQSLDAYITPAVDERLKSIPGGERWRSYVDDMERVADIYLRWKKGLSLTREDLIFLYEVERPIETTNYEGDTRVYEILKERDAKKDLSVIFECSEDKITLSQDNALNSDALVHIGNIIIEKEDVSDLKFPEYISGSIFLDYTKSAKNLKFPRVVMGCLELTSLVLAENLEFPERVNSDLSLDSLVSAKELRLPNMVLGSLALTNLVSAEGLSLPECVAGSLELSSLKSAKGLKLPKRVGFLNLSGLTSAEDLVFPKEIYEGVDLRGLKSIEELTLPENLSIVVYLSNEIEESEKNRLKRMYPNLSIKFVSSED